ncbi:uncharacterized protein BCR38DRAFT_421364 [Pseudomassariella vexata]|uniref:Uncharacterized protein n=1 Tax=Pseudomassariella vexata TaxID=1141098 RepID=A0A1Y2EFW2_9PEZI|nr:uncharacterized protein BCR38DRAFT_421364 [Pseudomassariella vexata]ORY70194.1 hypothetical protein BCR38DRAFT_421364 [Pseudomassariella vexata]
MQIKTCVLALALGVSCLAAPLTVESRGYGILSTGESSSDSLSGSRARGYGILSTGEESSPSSSSDSKRGTEVTLHFIEISESS